MIIGRERESYGLTVEVIEAKLTTKRFRQQRIKPNGMANEVVFPCLVKLYLLG